MEAVIPDIFDWSSTAASNTSVDGVSIAEGWPAANANNAIRSAMSIIRQTFASALQSFLAGTSALPIANGGTGATTSAGVLTAIGGLADTYRDLPVTTKSAAFTLANAERAGLMLYTGAAAAATIDPNSTTAINTGAVFVIRNKGSGVLTLTRGSGVTLYVNGSTTSANGSIAVGGVVTLIKSETDVWTATGSGLS